MRKSQDLIINFNERQKEFGYLQSLQLSRDFGEDNCSEYSLNITLCRYPFYDGDKKLVLSFFSVRDVKIGDLEGLRKMLININNISGDQLEGINFKVKEEENESFSFYCTDFEFLIL